MWLWVGGERSANAPTTDVAGGALQQIDPVSGELVATYRLSGPVEDVAAGPEGIWAIDTDRGILVRIDPSIGARETATAANKAPAALAATDLSIGLAAEDDQGAILAQIDPERMTQSAGVRIQTTTPGELWPVTAVSAMAITVTHGRAAVWVADAAGGVLHRLTRRIPEHITVDVGGAPVALAARDDLLWVGLTDEILALDFAGRITSRASASPPVALAAGAEGVWVAERRGVISQLDDAGKPNERIALGRRAVDLAVGQGSVWALTADGVLLRIDPASAEILAEIVVGPGPSAVAVSDGGVWVAVGAALPRSSSLADTSRPYRPASRSTRSGPPLRARSATRSRSSATAFSSRRAHSRQRAESPLVRAQRSRFGRAREARSSATRGRTAMRSFGRSRRRGRCRAARRRRPGDARYHAGTGR